MRRAFLSLYGLLVLSVITLGWGLDRLWNDYLSEADSFGVDPAWVMALAQVLDASDREFSEQLKVLQQVDGLSVKVVSVEAFAKSSLLERIQAGDPVEIFHEKNQLTFYQLMPNQGAVLRVQTRQKTEGNPLFYDLLLVCFYGALALIVFLWMWPLSRDLAKLEKQTRLLGKETVPSQLMIGPASAIYGLATAFQRMSERIRELLASHKEMTYAVSHELRTPLARMKFALEIAAAHQDGQKIQEKLRSVRDDVTEMDALVNQLLAYAGFDQAEQVMNVQPGDLSAMVEHLVKRQQEHVGGGEIDYVVQGECQHPVRCEWALMERAIINLLANAGRFAASQVVIRLYEDLDQVFVCVADDGPGIPEEDRLRVLNSFVRLTNHTNAQVRGFGLGLAIVQRVMTWHNGSVVIGEAEIGGAQVTLSWPKNL